MLISVKSSPFFMKWIRRKISEKMFLLMVTLCEEVENFLRSYQSHDFQDSVNIPQDGRVTPQPCLVLWARRHFENRVFWFKITGQTDDCAANIWLISRCFSASLISSSDAFWLERKSHKSANTIFPSVSRHPWPVNHPLVVDICGKYEAVWP